MTATVTKDSDLLSAGIAAARNGKVDQARLLLEQACREDPRNERAWLWQASLAETPHGATEYLVRVLAINPDNETALAWMTKLKPVAEEPPVPADYECPFCSFEAKKTFALCPSCRAVGVPDLIAFDDTAIQARQ